MPIPKASEIKLTEIENKILEEIVKRYNSPQILVNRSRIILESSIKKSNYKISKDLKLSRNTVMSWRNRWSKNKENLEILNNNEKELRKLIIKILSDEYRSGTESKFTLEQITRIIALSCESPLASGYPISNWSSKELKYESIKRGIVTSISESSIKRFLKNGRFKTSQNAILDVSRNR